MGKVNFRDIINWRAEQITLIELTLSIFAFGLIGWGMGSMVLFFVWLGWGLSITPLLLIILRLSTDRASKKQNEGAK